MHTNPLEQPPSTGTNGLTEPTNGVFLTISGGDNLILRDVAVAPTAHARARAQTGDAIFLAAHS